MEDYMDKKIPIRFFIITFLWSWLFFGLAILFSGNSQDFSEMLTTAGIDFFLMVVGAFGPAVGAIFSIYTIEGKGTLKIFFRQFLSLKFGWKVWLSIFLVLGITSIIAWIIPEFLGEDRLPMYLPSIYVFPIYILIVTFFGGGQEEIGWRGYIMPYLEKKYGLIIGGLILGIVWAIWHIPMWFLPGSSQMYMNFFGFMLVTIGYSYFFSWIIKASSNRLLSGLVVHGVANAFDALFPYLLMSESVKQTRMWLYNILILIIGLIIVLTRTHKKGKISI